LIVGLLSIGCLFGALAAAPFSDRIGRRKSMLVGVVVFYVGNTIQITAMHAWYQLGIGRFICGLAIGSLSGSSFFYLC
jgi:MFS transporter, SP family, sugar:H+ symporter